MRKSFCIWYDSTDWAGNLFNCPTVAYSGEIDTQKQAADMMQKAMEREGLKLTYIIGPQTKHAYHPESAKIVGKLMADLVAKGRDETPKEVHFTTYTLKYNTQDWVTVNALQEHWQRADVRAKITERNRDRNHDEECRRSCRLAIPTGEVQSIDLSKPVTVTINGEKHRIREIAGTGSIRIWNRRFIARRRQMGRRPTCFRRSTESHPDEPIPKQHDLQGPIDDAFMDSFIFVTPTGHSANPKVENWVKSESQRAIREWRRQFRGDARVKE